VGGFAQQLWKGGSLVDYDRDLKSSFRDSLDASFTAIMSGQVRNAAGRFSHRRLKITA
jgi:hypothetical protein